MSRDSRRRPHAAVLDSCSSEFSGDTRAWCGRTGIGRLIAVRPSPVSNSAKFLELLSRWELRDVIAGGKHPCVQK